MTMVQTALTLALLVGAGLLIRTMIQPVERAVGLQARAYPDDERHGGAGGLVATFITRALSECRRFPACSTPLSPGACR